jgi:hypothetical protein
MRRLIGIGVMVVTATWAVGLICAPPASALAPERQPFSFVGHGVIDCGTFVDAFDDFFNGFDTVYFDAAGSPIREVINVEHHSNDSNSVTGLLLHEHGHFTVTIDLLSGTQTVTGNSEIMNRPGTGVVIQDVGRAVFDQDGNLVFFAGGRKHSQLFLGDEIFCQALK